MKKIFITGGNGFIGREIIRESILRNYSVRAIVRSKEAQKIVETAGAESVAGQLTNAERIAKLMEGYDGVIHCAGVNGWDLPKAERKAMMSANEDTARVVAQAAKQAGIERFVLVSSAAATAQDAPFTANFHGSAYGKSKLAAEKAVRNAGIMPIIVRPVSVQGRRLTGTARMLIKMALGKQRVFLNTTLHVVYIDDCTRLIVDLLTLGTPGSVYTLNGAQLTTEQIYQALEKATGQSNIQRARILTPRIALLLARIMTPLWNLARKSPPLGRERVEAMLRVNDDFVDDSMSFLDWDPIPVPTWLRSTIDWYRKKGFLRYE